VNLLRSEVVLNDQNGEGIFEVVQRGRAMAGMPAMPAMPLPMTDVDAIAGYIHSVVAAGRGAPSGPPLNLLVGDAKAGATYFGERCVSCHSATGDMAGIGSRIPDVMTLQNAWVAGMRITADRENPKGRLPTVTVTPRGGGTLSGKLARIDNFLIVVELPDGTQRSFLREGDEPKVDIKDSRQGHYDFWPTLTPKDLHDVTAFLASLK
jgi:cytochrome c oxidase cbb3-type subunit 3